MKTREEVLVQAYEECLRDLYLNSEPPVDIKELMDSGFKDDENDPLRNKHFIDEETFTEIVEDTKWAYGIIDHFHDNLELIKNDLKNGPTIRKSKYEYRHLSPLKEEIGEEAYNKVIEYLDAISKFYRKDSDVSKFDFSIFLGASPSFKPKENGN
jgi:hypothetical protein